MDAANITTRKKNMKKQLLTLPLLLGLTTQAFAGEAVNTFQHEANVSFGTDTDHFEDGVWNLDYRDRKSVV